MSPRQKDHVLLDSNTGELSCEHCGDRWVLTLPCALDVAIAATKAYSRLHRRCKKGGSKP